MCSIEICGMVIYCINCVCVCGHTARRAAVRLPEHIARCHSNI